jgi:hypothetical protein
MKKTYLLIEQTRHVTKQNQIEDIHGVSDDIDTLKEVAEEENNNETLEWRVGAMSRMPYANRTSGKGVKTEFIITEVNNYDN